MNNFERCCITLAGLTALIAPVCAQNAERLAALTGGGANGAGKCTIEVYVDGSADVEIRGDRGFLRTLSGQPAQWRRFVCSGSMPINPGDFRFIGVAGRGKQQLIGRNPAIVRIQDSDGGAEGYTFELVWRGAGLGSGPTGQPFGGMDRGSSPNDAVRACQDAVRERANQQYGLRDINFQQLNADDNPGRRDTVLGSFEVRRGDYRDTYRFSCAMNLANGIVREVDISQARGAETVDRQAGRDDGTYACQRAAEQRIQGSGYRNVQFGPLNADYRQNNRIAGTATAQRGNNGRAYNFDIRCSLNPDNGNIRSVQTTRR